MGQSGWRIVVLSNIPAVVEMAETTLARLGHDVVGAVAARRLRIDPGMMSMTSSSSVDGTNVVVAEKSDDVETAIKSFEPDLLLSWAFPWRVSRDVLQLPTLGAINFHPSLLPRHRGPNAVAWTLRSGDSDFGVTWHRMDDEYDHGPILAQRTTPVLDEDTIFDIVPRMSTLALRMLGSVLARVANGDPGDPQPLEGATRAEPFGEDYATIDWSQPRRSIHNQVRAWAFTPGSSSVVGPFGHIAGQKVRVRRTSMSDPGTGAISVECGDGTLWIVESEPVAT